jgi:hypothetical protein
MALVPRKKANHDRAFGSDRRAAGLHHGEWGGCGMTNQSLRERFHLPESKAAIASQVIAATIESGLIKPDEQVGASRKFARYLPFWA